MSVDIDLPSTWVVFKPSLCRQCQSGCCTLPVEVSPEDLLRMGVVTPDEIQGSLKKTAKRLMREGIVRYYRAGERLFTLNQLINGDCPYLDLNRKCTIYDKRPDVCRRFPEVGPRPGYCPAQTRGPSISSNDSRDLTV